MTDRKIFCKTGTLGIRVAKESLNKMHSANYSYYSNDRRIREEYFRFELF